jgi:hypothetical protein
VVRGVPQLLRQSALPRRRALGHIDPAKLGTVVWLRQRLDHHAEVFRIARGDRYPAGDISAAVT